MKKLSLEIKRVDEKHAKLKYYIYFYRGQKLYFTSKRSAQDFLRLFNTNVNDCLRSLNSIASDIYSRFLEYFFQLEPITVQRFKISLDNYNTKLSFVFKEYGTGNQSFQINSFFILFDNINDCLNLLMTFAKSKNNYHFVNVLNSHLKTISLLLHNFKNSMVTKNIDKNYKSRVLSISYKKSTSSTA